MGKGHRRCEVCGIQEARHPENKLFFSKFPLDPKRCREWVKAVGNDELVFLPIEKLHEQRNICAKHFATKDFNKKGSRLKRNAIPTLHLMASPLTDSQLAEFPQHMYTAPKDLPESKPSTSQQSNILMEMSQKDHLLESVPSTSQQTRTVLMELSQNDGTITIPLKRSSEAITNKDKRKESPQDESNLSPREKKLLEKLEKTKCSLASFKRSAKIIDKLKSSVLREMVSAALTNQKRNPKGRRWTSKSKISALAIFKRSPKAYRYLQHLMPLPSVKTLHNVLRKIPVATGVNKVVMEHLKTVSSKKNIKDKYCGLVFDELALKRRLFLDITTDKVEGYEDFGTESGRSSQIADPALVFMLQGIKAKFKQPIAFYFVKGTVSSHKLASLIIEIIEKIVETGFKILTTICDQGPTNMGALKLLRTLTLPQNSPIDNYFICNGKHVYIIYDVPHLFKSIRNNFHKYGEMSMCGIKAKWEHLLQVEEKNRNLFYLSKITPMHVQPKYRAKMKVKYAAQILSTTVAAVVKLIAQAQADTISAESMMQTGTVIHDLDRLFDKTNGPSGPDDIKKGAEKMFPIRQTMWLLGLNTGQKYKP